MATCTKRRRFIGAALTIALPLAAGGYFAVAPGGAAADTFPSKPVTMLIGFRAGGGMDTTATVLIPELEKALGQPVVKAVHPGGGGAKAAALLKNADPDGYTVALAATSTVAFNPVFLPDKTPYRWTDFDYLVGLVGSGEAVMAKADAPYDTWAEMIAHARAGNTLSYSGQTPFDRLLIKYVNRREGVDIRHVPTKGGSEAIKNILGGHTELSFTGGNHLKHYHEGKIKFLASLRPERLQTVPDVPSLAELGHPIDFGNTFFIIVPKGTPDDVKATLSDALVQARDSEAFVDYTNRTPYFKADATTDEVIASIKAQMKRNEEMMALVAE